jgi:4-amino-4-deoxy-L-arabinose transferase-like glycosyltransferase
MKILASSYENNVDNASPSVWWREPALWFVVAIATLAYLPRLGDSPLRGEEPRRAQVAIEMTENGDWIVPREQGEPFESRPPLQNWLIAVSCLIVGDREPWTIRLHSVLAILATCFLIYGYARQFLGKIGATAAVLAFATCGEILQTGRQAETESLYIFLIAGSLMLWHWGIERDRNVWVTWFLPYSLAAMAALCKGGLQPPVYLGGAIVVWCAIHRRWRLLFGMSHFVAITIGIAIVGAWYLACVDRVGWETTANIWSRDTASRFEGWGSGKFFKHLLSFPFETFGCLLPWSPMLLAFLRPGIFDRLDKAKSAVVFCSGASAIAFATIWLPPDGATRYYTPLYPCIAFLIGTAFDRLSTMTRNGWRIYATTLGFAMAIVGFALPFAPTMFADSKWELMLPDPAHVRFYSLGLIACALAIFAIDRIRADWQIPTTIVALALAMTIVASGIFVDMRIRRTDDTAASMKALKAKLPEGIELVSAGKADALFAYYYGNFIAAKPWPPREEDYPIGSYFSVIEPRDHWWEPAELTFEYEEIGRIPVGRFKTTTPQVYVIVAKRLR